MHFNHIASFFKTKFPNHHIVSHVLGKHGYSLNSSYIQRNTWKTNAPPALVYDIFKEFKKKCAAEENKDWMGNLEQGSPGWIAMQKPPQ